MKQSKSLQTVLVVVGLMVIGEPVAAQTATDLECRNCVDGRDVENSTLTGADVRNGSLTGSDVRNGSMTGADVRNSTLTGADVRNGTLTGSDVRNSTLTGADVRNSSLTGSDIRNNSLTSSDIRDGTIQARDLAPDAVFMQTRIVSPVGVDDTAANGQKLLDVMADITATTPSATNAWLIFIEPGVYDMGSETLEIPTFVTVKGASATNTQIWGGGDGTTTNPTVALASNTELADVTVVHPGSRSETDVRAIGVDGLNWVVRHVVAWASNAARYTEGIGISTDGDCTGFIVDSFVVAQASAGRQDAIYLGACSGGNITIDRVTATALGPDNIAMANEAGGNYAVKAASSLFDGNILNFGVMDLGAVEIQGNLFNQVAGTLKVIASEVNGGSNSGSIACISAYDDSGSALNATCGF